jgi:hypothetical protein
MVLAVKVGEVAKPLELVDTTQVVPLQGLAKVPEAPEVGAVKVTLAPEKGFPS